MSNLSLSLGYRFTLVFKVTLTLLSLHLLGLNLGVNAEKHTIRFNNQCGYGSPRLLQKGTVLSTGDPYTHSGPFWAGIAYLQTGNCWLNGEGCTVVEMSLANPTCPGCGSSADISLIPPLAFSVPTTFSYSGGCNGQGATCSSGNCKTAFFVPDDNHVQVQCQTDDVDLLITFCPPDPNTPNPIPHIPSTTLAIIGNVPSSLSLPNPNSSPNNAVPLTPSSSSSKTLLCPKGRASRRRRTTGVQHSKRSMADAKAAGVVEVDAVEPQVHVKHDDGMKVNNKRASGPIRRVRLGKHVAGKRRL